MIFTFVSNFINHHQMPFCEAMQRALGDRFCFVQTEPMSEARIADGWKMDALPSCVREYSGNEAFCNERILTGDITCFGWSSLPENIVTERLAGGRVTLRLSERIYREGQWKMISPRGLKAKYEEHIRFRNAPVYLLCAGAYVASDFALIKSYPDKMYRFGYFPKGNAKDLATLLREKGEAPPLKLLYAGRMIPLKHPEYPVRLLQSLLADGTDCTLTMCGDGELRPALEEEAFEKNIRDKVTFTGTLTPDAVREEMARAHIFLFPSNHLEGWGAVLNEAMEAACAVVASSAAGATPYLIRDGENGLIYDNDSYASFEEAARKLVTDHALRTRIGKAAHETIRNLWNAEVAAGRLIAFCEALLRGDTPPSFAEGPMSKAPVLKAPS